MIYTFNNLAQSRAIKTIAETHIPADGEFAFVYEEEKNQLNALSRSIENKNWEEAYSLLRVLSLAVKEKIPSHIIELINSHYNVPAQEAEARAISERAHIELDLTKQRLGENYKNAEGSGLVTEVIPTEENIIEEPKIEEVITDAGTDSVLPDVIIEEYPKKKKNKKKS